MAGTGASRNDQYDAENTCDDVSGADSRKSSGQYIACVSAVRTNFTR